MSNQFSSVAIETLGCKLNQAESESIAMRFAARGFRMVHPSDSPSIYILNTCTVTHIADRKSRHLLRLARRRNPDALIIATGCYPERASRELSQVNGVNMVSVNEEKARLPEILAKHEHITTANVSLPQRHRTRSFIKVQEGCSHFCSYCIVPAVRGPERSLPPDMAVAEVRDRVDRGYHEVVLTGTRLGSHENSLELLTRRILSETDVKRLRLSSLQPHEVTAGLLALWQKFPGRLCHHLHLPLQSGSDAVLMRMGRCYSVEDYEQAVSRIREAVPDVAITADLMVGFPGETEDDFTRSYRFCRRMALADIHVFTYSERPGTSAALMPDSVDERVKKERSERMLGLSEENTHRFRERFEGRTMMVLWEREISEGTWVGLTDNYIRVAARSSKPLVNRLTPAILGSEHSRYLEASLTP